MNKLPIDNEPDFLKNEIRQTLHEHQSHYLTSDTTKDALSTKTFTGIMGPFGTGKSTLSDDVLVLEPSIKPIHTTTTRRRKPEDPAGFKTADEGVTFSSFRDAVNEGSLVNYSVIPGADIYGTFSEDFPAKYTIGPFLPSSIHHISRAGFEKSHFVYIVNSGDVWRSFIEKSRRSLPPKTFQSRAQEGLSSIDFALNHLDTFKFIENIPGPEGIRNAAQKIAAIALNQSVATLPPEIAEIYLQEMRSVANELIEA